MLVRCVIEQPNPALHDAWLCDWANKTELELTQGALYPVLAVSRYDGEYFLYLLGDESDRYPLAFPAALFEVVEGHLPTCWNRAETRVAAVADLGLRDHQVCSFEPWAREEDRFYEKVLDEDPPTLRLFYTYRDTILAE